MQSAHDLRGRLCFSGMMATMLIINTCAVQCCWALTSGSSPIDLPAAPAEHVCPSDEKPIHVKARYHYWSSFRYTVSLISTKDCIVNISFPYVTKQSTPVLLLGIIMPLQLDESGDNFYVQGMISLKKTKSFCITRTCNQTYFWASEPVQLYLSAKNLKYEVHAYNAALVFAEATNVCGFLNGSGELLMGNGSSMYVFAPDVRHENLAPNNVSCRSNFNYSLTVRPLNTSAPLNVTALACPVDNKCASLLLNGARCLVGVSLAVPQSGLALQYVRHGCDHSNEFFGFIVSAKDGGLAYLLGKFAASGVSPSVSTATTRVIEYTATQAVRSAMARSSGFAAVTASTRGTAAAIVGKTQGSAVKISSSLAPWKSSARSTAWDLVMTRSALNATDGQNRTGYVADVAVSSSRAPKVSVDSGQKDTGTTRSLNVTVILATIAAFAVAALAIGVTTALLYRRRNLLFRMPPSSDSNEIRFSVRASDGEISMVENELYGASLKNL